MTGKPSWGPLAWRLLVAFVMVALSSVLVLTAAALLGTGQGLTAAQKADRQQAATQVAEAVSAAYAKAAGWPGVNLDAATGIATGAGAHLIVRDQNSTLISTSGHGHGMAGMGGGGARTDADVTVAGTTVGSVQLNFVSPARTVARDIAWEWIVLAAIAALVVALAMSWFVSSRIAAPLVKLTATAKVFSHGDRSARSGIDAPGELGELATTFDTMADQVSQADQARRNLTADVAHELRTPLAALQAGLEELRDGLAPADTERLSSLHDQSLRLGRVVDDLSQLTVADSAALLSRPDVVDLADLATKVLNGQAAQLRTAGLDIRTELADGVLVHADPDRVHQALGNILGNCTRYARQGDQVAVRVHSEPPWAVIQIADTGPGIPAAELPHVFDRLWRGRSAATVAGSGIGLAVARDIITAHGGTITAESEPGAGATFTIRLPALPLTVPTRLSRKSFPSW